MPIAQYLCDQCGEVLTEVTSEKYPANIAYAPANTISHLFECSNEGCHTRFIAFEEESGRWSWQMREKEPFNNILKAVREREERAGLKEEKARLSQEKGEIERMIADNPKIIAQIKDEMEDLKAQVNKLTDDYEEKSQRRVHLDEAIQQGRKRLEEIEKRLKELIHIQ